MRFEKTLLAVVLAVLLLACTTSEALADPCGMVPPIYQGQGPPIVRVGHQQTYVFYKDGVETFVIRPGFSGKVDEFGMLIPFPEPPAIRKVPDHIFRHIAAAVDPPEVVIDFRCHPFPVEARQASRASGKTLTFDALSKDEVRVVRQEAVGMYEVAVLEAGSAAALKKWMDQHGYRFPDGMDGVCNEYIEDQWCFVAVKTKVGQKKGVDPRPGQRAVESTLPGRSTFDGFVQAMGFRFETDDFVVPMRLSAFNDGELRNIVYLVTDGPRRIRSIPEEYVVRQVDGGQLFRNVTDPLPLRIIGGTEKDLQDWHRRNLAQRRDPGPKNGAARQLFAADLLAVSSGELSLPHEETEKELLAIGERFGLRGPAIDRLNTDALKTETETTLRGALSSIKDMTLTVVDGDFPREVLSSQNLTFAAYQMPRRRNNARSYDANLKKPGPVKEGVLKLGALDPSGKSTVSVASSRPATWLALGMTLVVLGVIAFTRQKP